MKNEKIQELLYFLSFIGKGLSYVIGGISLALANSIFLTILFLIIFPSLFTIIESNAIKELYKHKYQK